MANHRHFFTRLKDELFEAQNLAVWVYRIDLKHPLASGNKFYKLKYNIEAAKATQHDTLLSFGGAYSNHLYALAGVAKSEGLRSIGIVRGERIEPLNPILAFCESKEMHLHFVSRTDYRQKHKAEFIEMLSQRFGRFYLIPEGGSNALALKGTAEIPQEIPFHYDYLLTPCGTGGTLAGLLLGQTEESQTLGIAVLKGASFLHQTISDLWWDFWQNVVKQTKPSLPPYDLQLEYHFGGYAKQSPELMQFIDDFVHTQQIPIEPVYSGKLFYAFYDLARQGYFKSGSTVVLLHTGGLYE